MRSTLLAEAVSDLLNNSPQETWGEIVVGTDLQSNLAFDPLQCFEELTDTSLFVLPDGFEVIEGNNRKRIVQVQVSRRISIVLTHPFTEINTQIKDVTSWTEAKKLLDLHEEMIQWAIHQDFPAKMIDIQTEQFFDDPLERNVYMANLILNFEDVIGGYPRVV